MAANLKQTADKLRKALNTKGYRLLLNQRQFFGKNDNFAKTLYILNVAVTDLERPGRYKYIELYSSCSLKHVVYYMRDMWYVETKQEMGECSDDWAATRKEIIENGGKYRTRTV